MDDTPAPITTFEQFTAAMLESARFHPNDRWIVARTRSGERPTWLAGFEVDRAMWVPDAGEAAIYDHEGAEGARLRCSDLPDRGDVLYAVCRLKDGDRERLDAPAADHEAI